MKDVNKIYNNLTFNSFGYDNAPHSKTCIWDKYTYGTVILLRISGLEYIKNILTPNESEELLNEIYLGIEAFDKEEIEIQHLSGSVFLIYTKQVQRYALLEIKDLISTFISQLMTKYKMTLYTQMSFLIYDEIVISEEDIIHKVEMSLSEFEKRKINYFQIYNETYHERITISTIKEALENNEISLYYQPKVDLKTNKIIGVEALIRWFSKDYGYISPDKFIPIVETFGFMSVLGEWIVKRAISDMKELHKSYNNDLRLSVNVSPLQLINHDLTEFVVKIIEEYQFNPKMLRLEITENFNIDNLPNIKTMLNELKKSGISISIDDFGKGFNSISQLKEYDVDEVKLDKDLIDYIDENPLFVKAIIDLVHTTGAEVVAEGVETEHQFEWLKSVNCDLVQGYFLYKPMSINDLKKVLK